MSGNLRLALAASAAAVASLAAPCALAAPLYTGPASMAEAAVDTSFDVTVAAPYAGAADLSFVLDGFNSLDGQNFYEDDFTLSLNSVAIIKGTWNLGGGGGDVVYLAPIGATFDNVSGNGMAITWTGGHVNISSSLDLLAGGNTLTFSYGSLTTDHAGFQGQGDEGWAVHDIVVSQPGFDGIDAVPEPSSWAMLVLGFGGIGGLLRGRRTAFAV